MAETNQNSQGLFAIAGRLARSGIGAVYNRIELFALELQEERARLMGSLIWMAGFVLFGVLAILLGTATIIFLCAPGARIYVTAGFAVIYLLCAVGTWVGLQKMLNRQAFGESIDQAKKDKAWLESLN